MIQLVIIGIYLSLLLALGLFSNRLFRGTSEDYMLASHSIGPFLLLMSLFGTTMTAFALVGSTGEAYKEGVGVYGMLASSSGIIHSLCFFVIGVKLWRIGRRQGYTTQIEFFRERLGSDSIGLLLFPVLVGLVIPYLLIGVMAAGTVINAVTIGTFPEAFAAYKGGVPPWAASMVICCVVLLYVFFGGMRGTAWANTFQTIFFMVLGVITFYVIAMKLGGTDSLFENLQIASNAVSKEKLTRAHLPKTIFFTYMLIPLSVGMFPHLFQHWLTAKSANSFKLPVVAHPIFIMIVWAPCVLIGVWATTELASVPPTISPNGVLAFLVRTKTGNVLGGFLTAGVLAAIMSSLDSQFLCLGTMFTNDIALHYSKGITDRQRVITARVFVIVIVIVTYLFSLAEPRRVFQMGVWCFSGFSALFPLVLAALYWRRLTLAGAYAAILAAIGSWGYLFWKSNFGLIPNYSVDFKLGGEVYQTMPVATILLCSLVALIGVSLVTRPPDKKTLDLFFPSKG
jgi:SSS family solute:Na+ symporter